MKLIYFYENLDEKIPGYYFDSIKQAKSLGAEITFITNLKWIDGGNTDIHCWVNLDLLEVPFCKSKVGFWNYTLNRYFYIFKYAMDDGINEFFHMEGDCLLFGSLENIKRSFVREKGFYAVRDSPSRALGSLIYCNDLKSMFNFLVFASKQKNMNDMNILGTFPGLKSFPNNQVDACAMGQALDGTHQVPGIPFINETADLKVDLSKLRYSEKTKCWFYNRKKVYLLHIHSKNLKKFRI